MIKKPEPVVEEVSAELVAPQASAQAPVETPVDLPMISDPVTNEGIVEFIELIPLEIEDYPSV